MVLSIVGILTAIGVPSFNYVTSSNRISSEVNGLLGDMQYARSESVKQGLPVTICSSSGPNYNACSAATSWQSGWIVFADTNGSHTVDAGDLILHVQPAFTSSDTFSADNNFSYAMFNREGFASTGSANVVTVTLHAATPNASSTRCLEISAIGIPVTEKSGTDNCL